MTLDQPPSRILVGVDFDDPSARAVQAAGVLAAAFGATLTVVHAHQIDRPAYFTEAQMNALGTEVATAKSRCVDDVSAFVAQHTRAVATTRVEEGTPADVIRRLAPDFDLIVLGTHRRQGPRRWWLGSVADAVLRESPVPVLVVPSERKSS
jgi:nucleotide-binding universal stress UspA family protein